MSSIKPFVVDFFLGLRDSLLGLLVISNIDNDCKDENTTEKPDFVEKKRKKLPNKKKSKILPMVAQCCFLNGILLLLSMMVFENYIIPTVKYLMTIVTVLLLKNQGMQSRIWSWLEPAMTCTFNCFWVIPLFWLSKILNCLWFMEIADTSYRKKHGRPVTSLVSSKDSIFKVLSKTMADLLFSLQVEVLFLIQAQLVGLIPVVGISLSFVHMALLYSLYAFEYTWTNLGWTVVKRLYYIENNWSYFIGFGVIVTCLTNFTTTVISACIFGVVFPIFILSALEAQPADNRDYPLRIFSFVIWLTNKMFLFKTHKTKAS